MSLYILNRLNSRIVEAIRCLGDLSSATQTILENPDQSSANELAMAVKRFGASSDAILLQVSVIATQLETTPEPDTEIRVVKDKHGLRL
jgi:hypothetical protein